MVEEKSTESSVVSRKALNDQKEMKLLLDMYKGVSKDQRDKVQLMAAEKKARADVEDLRQQMKKMQVSGLPGRREPWSFRVTSFTTREATGTQELTLLIINNISHVSTSYKLYSTLLLCHLNCFLSFKICWLKIYRPLKFMFSMCNFF